MNDKGVIFDLDGVLVDTSRFHFEAWCQWGKRQGITVTEEQFRQTFGMQNAQIIPLLLGREILRQEIEHMSQWKESRYRDLAEGNLELMDGAEDLLKDLKNHDFLMAIGTSTPRVNLNLILENTKAGDYIDKYVTGEEIENGKPAPDTFLRAANKLGLAADKCVVVEDAVAGIEAAKAAKMKVVGMTTTRKRVDLRAADLIVDSLKELNAQRFEKILAES